ncbi:AP2 domain-containing protein [Streptococcus sp. E29BA]|uniref:AP2 domain-containing protein n=1 Tax=Streptococcus sp. E29BA TaxID=3278716 RepID=UPI00359D9224
MLKMDLAGQRFGRLVVLREVKEGAPRKHITWECQCDCGTIKDIRGAALKSGATKSCGCLNDEKRRERYKDLAGFENDNFRVLYKKGSEKQRVDWVCSCKHCENEIVLNSNEIELNKSCGCLKKGASKEYMASITDFEALKSTKPTAKSSTGVRGVYYSKRKQRYVAYINIDKKQKYLGSALTLEEAALIRRKAEILYWGK